MENMNPDKFKSRMQSLAYGGAMAAAARDYQKEMLEAQNARQTQQHLQVDIDDLLDDPELERLHAERLYALQKEAERRMVLQQKGHGEYQELEEGQFLQAVTEEERCVCHFFHQDFERCRILDKHLAILSKKYFDTRFIKLSAPDAPFFTVKLQVKLLPCLVLFCNGVAVDRLAGFDELGAKDDFRTARLEKRLLESKVILEPQRQQGSDDEDDSMLCRNVRSSNIDVVDEDSDFE